MTVYFCFQVHTPALVLVTVMSPKSALLGQSGLVETGAYHEGLVKLPQGSKSGTTPNNKVV